MLFMHIIRAIALLSTSNVQTFFYCSICKITPCRENKVDTEKGRTMTCLEEHTHSNEIYLCCDDFIHCKNFPKDKMINFTLGEAESSTENDTYHFCIILFF